MKNVVAVPTGAALMEVYSGDIDRLIATCQEWGAEIDGRDDSPGYGPLVCINLSSVDAVPFMHLQEADPDARWIVTTDEECMDGLRVYIYAGEGEVGVADAIGQEPGIPLELVDSPTEQELIRAWNKVRGHAAPLDDLPRAVVAALVDRGCDEVTAREVVSSTDAVWELLDALERDIAAASTQAPA